MEGKIGDLRQQFKIELSAVKDSKDVEQLKVRFLGKKGPVQDLMNALRESPADQRPALGKQINDLKTELSELCDKALGGFHEAELAHRIADEKIDVTLPGRRRFSGKKHPLTALLDEIIEIFSSMGFSVQYGPDIDSDWYNYEGRKQCKRDFRSLWINRLGVGAKLNGLSYSKLIDGLKKAGCGLDRKVLSEMAIKDPVGFAAVATKAKQALAK